MRTETVTYKIYKYNELSDDAKAKISLPRIANMI